MRKKKVFPQKSEYPLKPDAGRLHPPMIRSDPFGSYTGVPLDRLEVPVQDADDL